jgi:hypothetical protein
MTLANSDFKSVDDRVADNADIVAIAKSDCINCKRKAEETEVGRFVWLVEGKLLWWHSYRCK